MARAAGEYNNSPRALRILIPGEFPLAGLPEKGLVVRIEDILLISKLLNSSGSFREQSVSVRADKMYRADHDHKDDSKHK